MTIAELRALATKLPRVPLITLPTPMTYLRNFSKSLGNGVKVFIKRDDLADLGLGGNKLRKLEFSLGAAQAQGCDILVHGLAGQSNYCRQAAAVAAKAGMPCHLVLRRDHQTDGTPQGNLLLDHLLGATIHMVADRHEQELVKEQLVAKLKAEGHKPYLVGRQDEVFGAVAYALCLAEILEQIEANKWMRADYLCVSGRNGTQAGLVLGQRLLDFPGEILGFQVAPETDADTSRRRSQECADCATDAAQLLGLDEKFTPDDIRNTAAYAGDQYGIPTAAGMDALLDLARTEGIIVGPVYTAKGLSGLVDYVRNGQIPFNSRIVFLHTGGSPEVFAYNEHLVAHCQSKG